VQWYRIRFWCKRSRFQSPAPARVFMFDCLFYRFCVFTICPKNTLFVTIFCNSFCNVIFSSPEHKVLMVNYCDLPLSVVRRRPSCVVRRVWSVVRRLAFVVPKHFYLNIFFSETANWILTKLQRNNLWVVLYQICSYCSSWLHK